MAMNKSPHLLVGFAKIQSFGQKRLANTIPCTSAQLQFFSSFSFIYVFIVQNIFPSLMAPKPIDFVGLDVSFQLFCKSSGYITKRTVGWTFCKHFAPCYISTATYFINADICNRHAYLAGNSLCSG